MQFLIMHGYPPDYAWSLPRSERLAANDFVIKILEAKAGGGATV